jgi:hypothetical protein
MRHRNLILDSLRQAGPELIATFGAARLVRHLDSTVELVGGSEEDKAQAREWCTLFMKRARWRR